MGIFNTTKVLIYTLKESSNIIKKMKLNGSDEFYSASKNWAKTLLKKAGIEVEVNKNQLDTSKSYIIVANHSSYLDIPILLAYLDLPFVIMYKKELEKIPLFGEGLKLSPFISVIRTNPRDAIKSLEIAITLLNKGISVLIFPEGTRSQNGELGEFKKGATRIAYKSKQSILPVKIIDSYKLMPKNSFFIKKGKVKLDIRPELTFSEYKDLEEQELLARLKDVLGR